MEFSMGGAVGVPPIRQNSTWGFVDFKMAANENALTQPKFELGITGIIHNLFPLGKGSNKFINYFHQIFYGRVSPAPLITLKHILYDTSNS